jgi:hypothetical protein
MTYDEEIQKRIEANQETVEHMSRFINDLTERDNTPHGTMRSAADRLSEACEEITRLKNLRQKVNGSTNE